MARAQVGVSPEAAPAAPEAASPEINPATPPAATPPAATPPAATPPDETAPTETALTETAPATTPTPARLLAASISYEGASVIARGTPAMPVRFESAAGLVLAQEVALDITTQQLRASGQVQFERERVVVRKELRPSNLKARTNQETVRETAFGENLFYDFKTGQGTLDSARLRLATLNISTESSLSTAKNIPPAT